MPMSQTAISRAPRPSSLADVLDLILDKGLVIDAYVRVSALGIEALTIDARIVVASVDTYLRFAEAVNRLDLGQTETQGIQGLTESLTEKGAKGISQARRYPVMTDSSLYVYAIVPPDAALDDVAKSIEPAAGSVFTIPAGDLAAVVSPVSDPKVRVTRANLDVHQRVVERAAQSGTAIPMRFGVVADSEAELAEFLCTERPALTRLLRQYADCVEFRVGASYRGNVAIREASDGTAAIRRLRARISDRPPDATYYDRIALGELVAKRIERNAERDCQRLGATLAAAAHRAKRLATRNSDEVFRGAFLVHRCDVARFDRRVAEIADRESERMTFSVFGPLAAWDFVEFFATPKASRRRATSKEEEAWAS
jgi:hypothetical protein